AWPWLSRSQSPRRSSSRQDRSPSAGACALRSAIDIKELESMPEMHELAELFATIWGRPGEPPIDSSTLQALSHSGNYVVGAYSVEYLVDFYGPMDDGINTGDESDRLLVRWSLHSERAAAAAAGGPLVVQPDAGALLVPVPEDIVAIRRDDHELARRWRHQVREALGGAMSRGFRVTGFTRAFEYVLSP